MKILIAHDVRTSSPEVMYHGFMQAKQFNAHVYLIIVCPEKISQTEIDDVKAEMHAIGQGIFGRSNIEYETHVLIRGLAPGEDIVRYAEEEDIDLIVMGVKNTSKLGKLIFGSNAQYVILHSPCPVLTVRKTEKGKPG